MTASLCVSEAIQISGGSLKIVCRSETDKEKIRTTSYIDGQKIEWSEPRALARPTRPDQPVQRPAVSYDVKGVIFGLDEDTLKEIAAEIGARYIQTIGKPESKAKIVAYENGSELPEHVEVDGFRYKVRQFFNKPIRCNKCQQFGHLEAVCRTDFKCCRCGQARDRRACKNIEKPKCVNCSGSHSATYLQCPKYVETKQALKVQVVEKLSLNEAIQKV